uniref:Mab-21 domain-containing protein n=1 Tax=Trichobilharzia regenti TaxID=157069 RepID=A0AA85KN95_TRIRE|nr:unnamed protein product [Trichobilharzia regenti]
MDLLPTLYTNRLAYGSNNNSITGTSTSTVTTHNNGNSVVNVNSNTEVNLLHGRDPNELDDNNLPMEYHRGIYNLNYSHHFSNNTGDNNNSNNNNNNNDNNQVQHPYHQHDNHPLKLPRRHLSAIPNPMYHYLHLFYRNRVETRRNRIAKTLREIVQIAQEILHEVELQEPRFISTLKVINTSNSHQALDQKQQSHDPDHEDIIESTTDTCTSTTNTTNKMNMSSINSNTSQNGIYYDGLRVLSSNRFEITLFLNQMGVFNFMDDGSVPGGAVLKLSDGRKRSMSLWVEFITASGYLSARKIRARFYSLVQQALQKSSYRGVVRMLGQTSEVKLCIRDKYILQITPGFRCNGLWPRSASHWPMTMSSSGNQFGYTTSDMTTAPTTTNTSPSTPKWPSSQLVNEVKREGFCLLSQESVYTKDKQASAEGDAWLLDFYDAEERLLLSHNIRRQCFSILKTLADQYLTGVNTTAPIPTSLSPSASSSPSTISIHHSPPVIQEYDIKTLVLHECEKHPKDEDWTEYTLGDRINGILLQLISCLQHRRCPHYFLPQLDIFRGYSSNGMDITAKQTWGLLRKLLTCPQALEHL